MAKTESSQTLKQQLLKETTQLFGAGSPLSLQLGEVAIIRDKARYVFHLRNQVMELEIATLTPTAGEFSQPLLLEDEAEVQFLQDLLEVIVESKSTGSISLDALEVMLKNVITEPGNPLHFSVVNERTAKITSSRVRRLVIRLANDNPGFTQRVTVNHQTTTQILPAFWDIIRKHDNVPEVMNAFGLGFSIDDKFSYKMLLLLKAVAQKLELKQTS